MQPRSPFVWLAPVGVVVLALLAAWWFAGRAEPLGRPLERGAPLQVEPPDRAATADLAVPRRVVELPSVDGAAPPAQVTPTNPDRPADDAPAGSLRGLVLRGDTPLDGGHVDIVFGHHVKMPTQPAARLALAAGGGATRVAIGPDGRFEAGPLAPGDYTVGVDTTATRGLPRGAHAGASARRSVRIDATRPSELLVIVLGTARVEGHVYDDEGGPVAGALVQLSGASQRPSGAFDATSGLDGAYSIADIAAGDHWIGVEAPLGNGSARSYDAVQLTGVTEGEVRVHDFGTPIPATRVTGRVLDGGGRPVPQSGTLTFTRRGDGAHAEHEVATLAAFDVRLGAGGYDVGVRVSTSPSGLRTERLDVGELDVPPGGAIERDLALPGTTVRGRVTCAPGVALPANLDVSLRSADGRPSPVAVARVGDDGTFTLHGLGADTYTLDLWPDVRAAEGSSLEVRAGDRELVCELAALPR